MPERFEPPRCQESCCRGKIIFTELGPADNVAAERTKITGDNIKSYFCDRCSHIHLTSQANSYIPWKRKY